MNNWTPFNRPHVGSDVLRVLADALERRHLSGDGHYTQLCHEWLKRETGCRRALLTHSCTAALEMAALLLNLRPGDEVIMPSFTFVSTANAFVLRGAVPVFVDIRPDTLNIDERLIEDAITSRTRAICVVHYAGVSCAMDEILAIADRHGLAVVEDAAQAIGSRYKDKPLGSLGALGTLSFHETKNLVSGEGGALLINDPRHIPRAEIIREKGTNRSQFFRGEVDKYTWTDLGSSYLPGELVAAMLYTQFAEAEAIQQARMEAWEQYHRWAAPYEADGRLRRPVIPAECTHNAHIYYLLLPGLEQRQRFIISMKKFGIGTAFHYVPLHSSPAGQRFGRAHGSLPITERTSERLVRLPLWAGVGVRLEEVLELAGRVLNRPPPRHKRSPRIGT